MDYQAFIDLVLEKARAAGLADAEVFYSQSENFSVKAYKGEVDDYTSTNQRGLSLRVMQDGRTSYAFTEAFDEVAADYIVAAAKENLSILDADDMPALFEGGATYPDVPQAPADHITTEQKIALAKQMEAVALAADPDVTDSQYNTVATGSGVMQIQNTRGLKVSHASRSAVAYLDVFAKNGERISSGFAYRMGTNADFDGAALANEAVEEALAYRGAKSAPSGKTKVAFRALAFADLLETFSSIFSGESAQKGLSLFKGKVGQTVASPLISLIDDPLMQGGIASAPFDAEGVPTKTKKVVDAGVLTTLLHNRKSAMKDGVESTGNASKGSYAAPLGISPVQFHVAPGQTQDVLADMQNGILITDMQGMHAGANAASGDFSLAAKGFLIEDGKKVRAVDGITVAGNFYQLLKDVQAVGTDLTFNMSLFGSPMLWTQGLTIAGE